MPDLASQPVYICGPAAMMEPTTRLLGEQGVPEGQIRSEAFLAARSGGDRPAPGDEAGPSVSAATAVAAAPGLSFDTSGPPALTFARSGKRTLLFPGKTLLELSEEAGLDVDYECRSGICGRCKTRLLAGWATMEVQDALDEVDKANQLILLCQARSTDHVAIEA